MTTQALAALREAAIPGVCSCGPAREDAGAHILPDEEAGSRAQTMTSETLQTLVARNAPILFMHPHDRFMPCSVEWFMERSELWLHCQESGLLESVRIMRQGEVTGPGIAAAQKEYEGHSLQLRLDPAAQCGPPVDEIDETPLYANVKFVVRSDGSAEAIEINYLTFYAHNGWYDIGYLGLLKVGAHDGDWEHLTVRLSAASQELQGVYFNAHRSRDGCWVPAHQLERTSEGRLRVYVARHGHGTYPKAGIWWRAGLMANDRTSSSGAVWKPKTCFVLPLPAARRRLLPEHPSDVGDSIAPLPSPASEVPLQSPSSSGGSQESYATAVAESFLLEEGSGRPGILQNGYEQCLVPPSVDSKSCGQIVGPEDDSPMSHLLKNLSGVRLDDQRPAEHRGITMDRTLSPAHLVAGRAEGAGQDLAVMSAPTVPEISRNLRGRRVELHQTPSRGSRLPAPLSGSAAPFAGDGVRVLEHSGEWLEFLGQWGTTPSPAAQGWFWSAEPPVSRGVFLRILGHPWPETDSI